MKQWDDDDYQCYKFSDKLKGKKWNKYTMDALNMAVRDDFMKTLSFSGIRGEKIIPPVGLHFKSFIQWKHKKQGTKILGC